MPTNMQHWGGLRTTTTDTITPGVRSSRKDSRHIAVPGHQSCKHSQVPLPRVRLPTPDVTSGRADRSRLHSAQLAYYLDVVTTPKRFFPFFPLLLSIFFFFYHKWNIPLLVQFLKHLLDFHSIFLSPSETKTAFTFPISSSAGVTVRSVLMGFTFFSINFWPFSHQILYNWITAGIKRIWIKDFPLAKYVKILSF